MINTIAIVSAIAATLVGAFGSLYLKKGAKHFNLNILKQLKNKNFLLGVLFFIISTVLYLYALSLERLSIVYPIVSVNYIWAVLISIKFLGEKMNKHKWLGVILITLGVLMIGYFSA